MKESIVRVLGFVRATDTNSEKWNIDSIIAYRPKTLQPFSNVDRYRPVEKVAPKKKDRTNTCNSGMNLSYILYLLCKLNHSVRYACICFSKIMHIVEILDSHRIWNPCTRAYKWSWKGRSRALDPTVSIAKDLSSVPEHYQRKTMS